MKNESEKFHSYELIYHKAAGEQTEKFVSLRKMMLTAWQELKKSEREPNCKIEIKINGLTVATIN